MVERGSRNTNLYYKRKKTVIIEEIVIPWLEFAMGWDFGGFSLFEEEIREG